MAKKIQLSRLALRSASQMVQDGHPAATAHCALAKLTATDFGTYYAAYFIQFSMY
jgi:alkylation response protein AidB-like acyl-CoA dehydrogenase